MKKKHLETKFLKFLLERQKQLEEGEDGDVNVPLPEDGEDLPPVIKTHRMKPIDIPIEEEKDEDDLDWYNTGAHYHVHCAGGYRSVIATSLLKHQGFYNLTNVYGGMGVIKNTVMPLVHPVVAV